MSARFPERAVVVAIHAGIGLLLLTPLAVAPGAAFPFIVGKAVYSRTLVDALVVLWVTLAAFRPAYRPPRSALLLLLGAGLLIAALSAAFGVSPVRSVWSSYVRMEGLMAHAHWVAVAVVAASTVRTAADWRRLLTANVAVGLAVAVVAVLRSFGPETPFVGALREPYWPRISATFGNPTFLGAYLQFIALLAAGLLARSLAADRAETPEGRTGRRRHAREAPRARRWPMRLFAGAALACALWGVSLTGSMGAFAGIAAGVGTAGLLWGWLAGTRRERLAGLAALATVAALGLAVVLALALRPPTEDAPLDPDANPLLQRVTNVHRISRTLDKRLANWASGLRAFADRPWLGWGTDNYLVASARHIAGPHAVNRGRDHAHNLIVAEAATKGAVGLAAYLALWGFTALAVVRAARRARGVDRAFLVCVGGALAGWFVQSQTLFQTAGTWIEHMLLLAYLARLGAGEPGADRAATAPRPALKAAGRIATVAVAVAVAAASAASSWGAYAGAGALYRAETAGPFMDEIARAIEAFEPMAAYPRAILFENVARNWPVLHARHRAEARRLLAWSDREAPRALAAEPENWQIHHTLARLYGAVAQTTPGYAERAAYHVRRSLEVAPNLDPSQPNVRPRRAGRP